MKYKLIPVIFTAALTSVLTLGLAFHFQKQSPFMASTQGVPVHYASYGNTTVPAGAAPVNFENAAESTVKAVVHIKTTTKARTVIAQDPAFGDFWGDIFGRQQYYIPPQMGSGSGVVISPDGYIVTNNHVVANANEVTVTFNDRYTTQAKVVATDPATDIAVIKVNETGLSYMEFGNSDDVKLGQWVLAVGYPLSLDATVTAGIVSAKGRSIGVNKQAARSVESYIQTDAAVNPGNSGGALVNTSGQLIGINSAIASPTGSYAGYSYAIPANMVQKAVKDLIKYGSVQRAYLGIEYLDRKSMSPEQLSSLKLDKTEGIYVANVMSTGGAAKAGLQKGDFITEINGIKVNTEPQLVEQIARYQPGDNISVTYLRNGNTYKTTIQLKNLDGTTDIIKEKNNVRLLGASFRSLNDAEKNKLGLDGGVIVTEVGNGMLAKQTDIKKGFVIKSINNTDINTVDDLQAVVGNNGGQMQIAGLYPGYQGMYYYGIKGNTSGQRTEE